MRNLPQVFFDSTGSACVRLSGRRVIAVFHYIPVSLPLMSMVCPATLSEKVPCLHCNNAQNKILKHIDVCWDRKRKRWAFLVASKELFNGFIDQCQKMGITYGMIESGDGPDIVLQRIGKNLEFELLMGTMGTKIPTNRPDMDEVMEKAARQSCWARCETENQVLDLYSRPRLV